MVANILSFLTSPRFKSFVGHALAIGAVALLNDFTANIGVFNLSTWEVTGIGLIVAQLVGALNNYVNNQPTGLRK